MIDLYFTPQVKQPQSDTQASDKSAQNGFFSTLVDSAEKGQSTEDLLNMLNIDGAAIEKIEEALLNMRDVMADNNLTLGENIDAANEDGLIVILQSIIDALGTDQIPTLSELQDIVNELELDGEHGALFLLISNLTPEELSQDNDKNDAENADALDQITTHVQIVDPDEARREEAKSPEDIAAEITSIIQELTRALNQDLEAVNDAGEAVIAALPVMTELKPVLSEKKQLVEDIFSKRGGGASMEDLHSKYYGESDAKKGRGNAKDDLPDILMKSAENLKDTNPALSQALQNQGALLGSGQLDLTGFAPLLESFGYTDPILSTEGLLAGLSSALSSTSALATSPVTQANGAAAPHPGSQIVASMMQKNASESGDKVLRLQMDPPELGRVEVHMSIDKNKALKATVIAEKPETHLMLQRDAQLLERALQDSGIDSDGGLSFELAEHGFDFDQQNQRGGGHDQGGQGAGETAEDEIELIESTMTFHVDPKTGYMRFNIMA